MKRIAAIGLLILLLYNMFGLTTAIFLFEDQHKSASLVQTDDEYQLLKVYMPSLPYTEQWENEDGLEGLFKAKGQFYNATHVLHTNDTLYVTMKSNQPARDHFFELVQMMQSLTDSDKDSPDNMHGKAIKLLSNLLKNYLQNKGDFLIQPPLPQITSVAVTYQSANQMHASYLLRLQTPPPETNYVL
ncbi:hypothetical protein [Dyadobacter sp. LHD-138]|uniref:hypothetical protein n=1 Tax=Dyadobacter sp. LHD-138 TaxID=3071413 RepID=UPI0027DF1AA0|nr:hypothetical protein [Dyadobacter sp. LHD-138]MDQ6477855.1 hypothetical protein [Dyadobacter sp. LHD-138]